MRSNSKSIFLIFPMYNEIEYVEKAYKKATDILDSITTGSGYEIVIIYDASTDGSQILAQTLSKKDNRLKIFRHAKNRKLGDT